MDIGNSNSYSVHLVGYAHTLNNNTQHDRGGQMVAFINLMRARMPEAKKNIGCLDLGGSPACDKKEHPPFRGRNASAARALRRRNGPTIIAVHRRCDNNAPEGPVSTDKRQNPGPAPHIYKYTIKIHYNPFRHKIRGSELLFFITFFPKPKRIYESLVHIKFIRIFKV